MLPGRKGINLTPEQYKFIVSLQGDVGKLLKDDAKPAKAETQAEDSS
jgi:hypothetical protein